MAQSVRIELFRPAFRNAIRRGFVAVTIAVGLMTAYAAAQEITVTPVYPRLQNVVLFGINMLDEDTAIAVGELGVVRRTFDGSDSWSAPVSVTRTTLRDVRYLASGAVVAIGDSGVIIRSTDKGATWMPVRTADGSDLTALSTFGDRLVAVGLRGTVFISNDDGLHWGRSSFDDTLHLTDVELVDDRMVIALALNGDIYRSENAGLDWTLARTGTGDEWRGLLRFDTSIVIALSDQRRSMRSDDGGRTWRWQTIDSSQTQVFVLAGATAVADGVGIAYYRAIAGTSRPFDRLHRTTNYGLTWIEEYAPRADPSTLLSGVNALAAAESSVLGVGELYRAYDSRDGGRRFSSHVIGTGTEYVDLAVADSLIAVIAGQSTAGYGVTSSFEQTVDLTTDGGSTWTTRVLPLSRFRSLTAVDVDPSGFAVAIGHQGSVVVTDDLFGTTTADTASFAGELTAVDILDASHAVIGDDHGRFLHTTDRGRTWSMSGVESAPPVEHVAYLGPGTWLGVSSSSDGSAAATVRRTTDGGRSYGTYSLAPHFINGLAVRGPDCVWIVGGRPAPYMSDTTAEIGWRTTNKGSSWTKWRDTVTPAERLGLADISFTDEARGLAVTNYSRVLSTTDGGTTWRTHARITPWSPMAIEAIGSSDALLLAGLDALFRIHVTNETADHDTDQRSTLSVDSLFAFPNPANEDTRVEWVIRPRSQMQLYISDALGRVVWTLSERSTKNGRGNALIDTEHWVPGIYVISLRSGLTVVSTKLVIR